MDHQDEDNFFILPFHKEQLQSIKSDRNKRKRRKISAKKEKFSKESISSGQNDSSVLTVDKEVDQHFKPVMIHNNDMFDYRFIGNMMMMENYLLDYTIRHAIKDRFYYCFYFTESIHYFNKKIKITS